MKELLEKVKHELEKIGDKGLTSSNLDTTYKLIDILKDIHEAEYYKYMREEDSYNARARDSRGRYMEKGQDSRYSHYQPWDDRTERYFTRIRDGIDDYSAGRVRYQDSDGSDREQMIKGIEMAMSALVSFVETLYDHAETSREKDVIMEHIDKLKKL